MTPEVRKDRLSKRRVEEKDRRNVSPEDTRRRQGSWEKYSRWNRGTGYRSDSSNNSPVRDAEQAGEDAHHSKERERKHSHSLQEDHQSSYGRSRGRRSHSKSPMHTNRSSGRRHSHSEKSPKSSEASQAKELTSKWARHHDSAESSSDEEDLELEKAFLGQNKEKETEEEDLFGLGKLSQEMLQ